METVSAQAGVTSVARLVIGMPGSLFEVRDPVPVRVPALSSSAKAVVSCGTIQVRAALDAEFASAGSLVVAVATASSAAVIVTVVASTLVAAIIPSALVPAVATLVVVAIVASAAALVVAPLLALEELLALRSKGGVR